MTSSWKRLFQPWSQPVAASVGLLIVRLITGVAFLFHGWGKIQNPFGWMGAESPVPGLFQFLAALSEFGGGLALIVGLLVPLASLGLAGTMLVAVYMHMVVRGDPFVAKGGGPSYEPALVFFGIALLLLAVGPGKLSLDAKVFGERSR